MDIPALQIKVRWSDLDANMHLANSSYMNFTAFARMERFSSIGLGVNKLKEFSIGPVIYHENFSFFKEILPSQLVYVTAEITGISKDAALFEFTHNFYNADGQNLSKSYVMGTWIDYNTRKRVSLPMDWAEKLTLNANTGYKKLSMEDVKKLPHRPKDINPERLNFFLND